jgi:hypothetical protein
MAANLLFDRLANGDIEQGAFEADFQDDEGDDDNLFNLYKKDILRKIFN